MITIITAREKYGCTMPDRGTYIKFESQHKGTLDFVIV